ncbi:MAG: NfeD family protein [Faecalibacterium sp.]|nr:NfeD family protein [Ruminococcus sp.]MCM1391649.1 NfeD family protein [Ruminococcus sp.]MCM1485742.1 NfeD family protein [Faecalibacterium sp.]
MDPLLIMWIALSIIFAVIEAATAQIVTIWFAVGSIGAIITNVLGVNSTGQLIVFVALSVLTLVIARPYLKKFTKTQVQPTNADMCIGQQAIVTEDIDNTLGTGLAIIKGVTWTARSIDGSKITKDSLVIIESIEGVKLMVRKIDN